MNYVGLEQLWAGVEMKICLLTYGVPHRKTAQVFMGLHNRGFRGIDFLLMPFLPRPAREVLFQHRPPQFEGPSPQALAGLSGGVAHAYERWPSLLDRYDYFLVCGSNLIEPDFANCGKVLNVHAGLIPLVRGLDSFKWAILKGLPLGNTLHVIDSETDAGEVVAHMATPVFPEDDIQTLAARHYDNEIWMLQNFDTLLDHGDIIRVETGEPTKRMPISTESIMLRAFAVYKDNYAIGRDESSP